MPTPSRILVGITGFGSTLRRDSGLEQLLLRANEQIDGTLISRFCWNDDIQGIACWIRRVREDYPHLKTYLVGHSYGGFSCSLVADRLRFNPTVEIDALFLADAVWRPHPTRPAIRSIHGRGEVVCPDNVRALYSWRQSNQRIRGADIHTESDHTQWVGDFWCDAGHNDIDDLEFFHNTVLEVLRHD